MTNQLPSQPNTPSMKKDDDSTTSFPAPDLRYQPSPRQLSRELFLCDAILPSTVAPAIQHLRTLDIVKNPKDFPTIVINSPGGDVYSGLALIDVMDNMQHPCRTMVVGYAASMASFIFLAGTPGFRLISKNAVVMLHPSRVGFSNYMHMIEDSMKMAKITGDRMREMLKHRTNLPKALIEKAEAREVWLSADEAIKYGLADHILPEYYDVRKAQYQQYCLKRAKEKA